MDRTRATLWLFAIVLLLATAGTGSAQSTGYWQYVRTDTYSIPDSPGAVYPTTHTGTEGDFIVTESGAGVFPGTAFTVTLNWSRPPSVLIPGTALYWPVAATVGTNIPQLSLGLHFLANACPYQTASNPAVSTPVTGPKIFEIDMSSGMAVGTVTSYNNALQNSPLLVGNSKWGDSNGFMTILTQIDGMSSSVFYWSYVYQWVAGSMGTCGGACTLASPGQSIGVSGGSGNVNISATSTWNVVAVDSWITVTSATSGAGNSTVTFTVAANTGGPRSGSLIIGGQPYTIYQSGSAASTGNTSIAITNPGFETLPTNPSWINCAGNGGPGSGGTGCRDTLDGNVPGWTASSSSVIGLFQPGPNYFTVPMPAAEGQTGLQINSGNLSQILSATLQVSTVYTLQVDIGRRMDNLYPSPPPSAQLFAGSTPIASATGTEPPLGGWTTWTGTYQSTGSDPLAGQALKIVLGVTAPQGNFDNVKLTAAPVATSPTCSPTLGATSASATAAGGSATVTVTAGAGCTWTAASNASWITSRRAPAAPATAP